MAGLSSGFERLFKFQSLSRHLSREDRKLSDGGRQSQKIGKALEDGAPNAVPSRDLKIFGKKASPVCYSIGCKSSDTTEMQNAAFDFGLPIRSSVIENPI